MWEIYGKKGKSGVIGNSDSDDDKNWQLYQSKWTKWKSLAAAGATALAIDAGVVLLSPTPLNDPADFIISSKNEDDSEIQFLDFSVSMDQSS